MCEVHMQYSHLTNDIVQTYYGHMYIRMYHYTDMYIRMYHYTDMYIRTYSTIIMYSVQDVYTGVCVNFYVPHGVFVHSGSINVL